jgi:nicotinate-nucleotide adenylyltransferase
MRIAIFGGAFDPPHNGHLAVISKLLNSGLFGKVLVVPSGDRPDKLNRTPSAERVQMTKLALNDSFSEQSNVELFTDQALGKIGYGTIDLIREISTRYPNDELSIIIGDELIKDLPLWKEADHLRTLANFVVLARPGTSGDTSIGNFKIEHLDLQPEVGMLLSSSYLRDSIKCGRVVAGFIPSIVFGYISLRKLYKSMEISDARN